VNLLFGSYADRTGSTGSNPRHGIADFDLWLMHRTILPPRTQRIWLRSRSGLGSRFAKRIFGTAGV